MDVNNNSMVNPECVKFFVDVVKINRMVCPLGKTFMLNPVQLPCKHVFSERQLSEWYFANQRKICPICTQDYNVPEKDVALGETMQEFVTKISRPNQQFMNRIDEAYNALSESPEKQKIKEAIDVFSGGSLDMGLKKINSVMMFSRNEMSYVPVRDLMKQHATNFLQTVNHLIQQVQLPIPVNNQIPGVSVAVAGNGADQHPSALAIGNGMAARSPAIPAPISVHTNGSTQNVPRHTVSDTPPPPLVPLAPRPDANEEETGDSRQNESQKRPASSEFYQPVAKRLRSNATGNTNDIIFDLEEENGHSLTQENGEGDVIIARIVSSASSRVQVKREPNREAENGHTEEVAQDVQMDRLIHALKNKHKRPVYDHIKSSTNVNVRDENGNTPVHLVVLNYSKIENLIPALLQKGALLNLMNHEGETALHLAAKMGRVKEVKFLINLGASKDIRNLADKLPKEVAKNRQTRKAFK